MRDLEKEKIKIGKKKKRKENKKLMS